MVGRFPDTEICASSILAHATILCILLIYPGVDEYGKVTGFAARKTSRIDFAKYLYYESGSSTLLFGSIFRIKKEVGLEAAIL